MGSCPGVGLGIKILGISDFFFLSFMESFIFEQQVLLRVYLSVASDLNALGGGGGGGGGGGSYGSKLTSFNYLLIFLKKKICYRFICF